MSYRRSTNMGHLVAPKPQAEERASSVLSTLNSLIPVGENIAKMYKGRLDAAIASDTVRQKARAARGQLPSEDATVGGYRAAAEVNLAIEASKSQAYLEDMANKDISDEDWERELVGQTTAIREQVFSKYPNINEEDRSALLQRLDATDTQLIPKLTGMREASRLKREQKSRVDDSIALFSTMTEASPENLQAALESLNTHLKLGNSSSEEVAVRAALGSTDVDFMRKVANLKSSRGIPLGVKNPELETLIKKTHNQNLRLDAGTLALEKDTLINKLADGELTEEGFASYIKDRNEQTSGSFATTENATTMLNRARKMIAEREKADRLATEVVLDESNLRSLTKGMRETVMTQMYDNAIKDATALELRRVGLDDPAQLGDESNGIIKNSAIKNVSSEFAKQGYTYQPWVSEFKELASLDPEKVILPDSSGEAYVRPDVQEKLNTFLSIPPAQRFDYTSGKDSVMMNSYASMVQAGLPQDIALRESLTRAKMPVPPLDKEKLEASESIVDSLYRHYFSPDIPKGQQEAMQDYVGAMLSHGMSTQDITQSLTDNSFQLENGSVITANPHVVAKMMGVYDVSQMSAAFDQFIERGFSSSVQRRMNVLGLSKKDIYWELDKTTSQVVAKGTSGLPITGLAFDLFEIGANYDPTKVKPKADLPKPTLTGYDFRNARF